MKLIFSLFFFFLAPDLLYEGSILKVSDGDTFMLQTEGGIIKVRLDGIDCPEKKQPYGKEAMDFLNRYSSKNCKVMKKSLDRYGRTIGVLWVDNVNVNLLMVQEGYAWHFKKYSKDTVLANAEIEARKLKKGLWNNENAVAPWKWRKR